MTQDFLWEEKYRPHKIADVVLPPDLKAVFQAFVTKKTVPNLLLSGPPGTGKTTVAKAMLDELGADYIVINASMHGNIDTLRTDIMQFASSISMGGARKYVILDEADYLNPNSTQPALRNFIDEYSQNCGFIFTCNYKHRIISPLSESRLTTIDFMIPKTEMAGLSAKFFSRLLKILEGETVAYEKMALVEVIKKYAPDWRRVINEVQKYAIVNGKIDAGILVNQNVEIIKELVPLVKDKNFTGMRKWTAENKDLTTADLFRAFYDAASSLLVPATIPVLVVILAKYQYQAAFVADHEINTTACFAEIMMECKFK